MHHYECTFYFRFQISDLKARCKRGKNISHHRVPNGNIASVNTWHQNFFQIHPYSPKIKHIEDMKSVKTFNTEHKPNQHYTLVYKFGWSLMSSFVIKFYPWLCWIDLYVIGKHQFSLWRKWVLIFFRNPTVVLQWKRLGCFLCKCNIEGSYF